MPIDLRALLVAHQRKLISSLGAAREVFEHPTAKGQASESDWIRLLSDFLPRRYQVSKAFVLDADGQVSDQIDVVIHDRHFCPLFFEQGDDRYVPAESVYSVFEIRQELNRENVLYAIQKAASVRRLRRTSVIAAGMPEERKPTPILAGVLCLTSTWSPAFGQPLETALAEADETGRLDLGCALEHGAFEVSYRGNEPSLEGSEAEGALMFLLLRLFARLQQIGTVAAIDLREYARVLENR